MLKRTAVLLKTEPEVIALSFARMADALGNSLLIIILPLYIAAQPSPLFDLPTELLVGIAISLYGFIFALSQPFWGYASDRLGKRKPFILAGLLLMMGATLGFMFADRYLWILVLRGLQGVAVAMIIPSVLVLISRVTVKRSRGNAMGVYSTFRMVGFATGPLLGGFLHVKFGFNSAFIVGAAFLVVAMVLVQLTVKEEVSEAEVPGAGGDPPATPSPDGASRILPSATILGLMVSTIVLACSLSMISALENEFNDRLSQTAIGFGVAFSALTVSRLFVQIPIGRLSDRIGRKMLIIGGLLALAPLTVLFGYVTSTAQLVGLRLLQGVATAGVAAPAFALAGDLARKGGEGRDMSFVTMGFGLGMGLGPLLAGGLAGYVGFTVPFYVVGGFCLVAAAWVWRWAEESIAPGEWALDEV
jgi:MFS family permease